jgi:hypothetical protein
MSSLDMSARIASMPSDIYTLNLIAQTDSHNVDDLLALARIVKAKGFLRDDATALNYATYGLTAEAWERIEALEEDMRKERTGVCCYVV